MILYWMLFVGRLLKFISMVVVIVFWLVGIF